jgi:PhoPQ-activated pathogenicity-related protein
MPMTKAAKRAMDTITEVAKIRRPDSDVQKFIIYGASKRGWTTWSIAAVDKRVVAMAPMVFSLINMDETLQGHFKNMDGAWSFALRPYFKENLTQEFFNEKTKRVWEVEDMYSYKERYTIPILEIVSTGDEFFLLDDNHHWWHDIPSDNKYLMMMPNSEHSMAPHYLQIYATAVSFGLSVLRNVPMPRLSWDLGETETGGYIRFFADPPPLDIRVFRAVTLASDTRRDFRLVHGTPDNLSPHPVIWRRNVLHAEDLGGGEYYVEAEKVEGEWVGFFVEAEWEGPSERRMIFTSQVNIIPNTYPHEACTDSESCWGTLV